ncbi:MAG: hypothetical protein ABIQ02_12175, partial [Saprospiraceae bacterium]
LMTGPELLKWLTKFWSKSHNMKHKLHLHRIIQYSVLILFTASCDLINPAEQIPTKIKLAKFDLQTQPEQGSDQNKITDIWVYAGSSFLGVFAPPVQIPFLAEQEQTHFIFHPGIRNNGIANDAIIYPLYTSYEVTLPTLPGTLVEVNPVTHYKPNVVVSLNADFETGNEFVDNIDSIPGTFVARSPNDPFEGDYSGEIVLTATSNYIVVGNALAITGLPTDGRDTYLEFQYKSEMDFSIGLLGISLDGLRSYKFFYLVKPTENWNMLYIELTDLLKVSDFPAYEIVFRSVYPSDATKAELKIRLDNIKVVHI